MHAYNVNSDERDSVSVVSRTPCRWPSPVSPLPLALPLVAALEVDSECCTIGKLASRLVPRHHDAWNKA